jgi:hypothetical protein
MPIADLYQGLLGFPSGAPAQSQLAARLQTAFRNHFCTRLKVSRDQGVRHILSIGTGYGRIDLPLIAGYIAHVEDSVRPNALSGFEVSCIEPDPSFLGRLREHIRQENCPFGPGCTSAASEHDGQVGHVIHGTTASGKSSLTLRLVQQRIEDFLRSTDRLQVAYDLMVSALSLQFVTDLKRVFPELMCRLVGDGAGTIVLGESFSQGAWLSVPPEPVPPGADQAWWRLWQAWHQVLSRADINLRLRLIMPHNLRVLLDAMASSGFVRVVPKPLDFEWQHRVSKHVMAQFVAAIQSDGWRGTISSLALPTDEAPGLLDTLMKTSKDWQAARDGHLSVIYENGVRLRAFRSPPGSGRQKDRGYLKYRQRLQSRVLSTSTRTVRDQGLLRTAAYSRDSTMGRALESMTESMRQHLEYDEGCFLVTKTVDGEAPNACMACTLSPAADVASPESRAYFNDLGLGVRTTVVKRRAWLFLYMLYLALPLRPSRSLNRLMMVCRLPPPPTDVCVRMDEEEEELSLSEGVANFTLAATRCKEFRKRTFSHIRSDPSLSAHFREILSWDSASAAVQAAIGFWGQDSAVVKAMAEDETPFPPLLSRPKDPEFGGMRHVDHTALFGRNGVDALQRLMEGLLKDWASDDEPQGILQTLRLLQETPGTNDDASDHYREIVGAFYATCLFLPYERLVYHDHIAARLRDTSELTAGFHIFLRQSDYKMLQRHFEEFIVPFDYANYSHMVNAMGTRRLFLQIRGGMLHSWPATFTEAMKHLRNHEFRSGDTCGFKVPVELYLMAFSTATMSGLTGSDEYAMAVPVLRDVEERVLSGGLDEDTVREHLAQTIAWPLARARLGRDYGGDEMPPQPLLLVKGSVSDPTYGAANEALELGALVATLIALLKEAYEHAARYALGEGADGNVHVSLAEDVIAIANPCHPESSPAIYLEGASCRETRTIAEQLHLWRLDDQPTIEPVEGYHRPMWVRRMRRTGRD